MEERIHTMPEKFVVSERKGSKRGLLMPGIIGLVVLVVMVIGAAIYLNTLKPAPSPEPKPLPKVVVVNKNENINTNANVNKNANTNLNTNKNVNINLNVNVAPPPPSAPLLGSADDDLDGLTNQEEILYKTDPAKPDTDEDGYLDGHEVFHLYNPAGFEPMKLEDTDIVSKYSNPSYKYSILHPTSWIPRPLDETNQEVMFTADTGEFMQIIAEESPGELSPFDWYVIKSPGIDSAKITPVVTKNGLEGIRTPDKLSVFFIKNGFIYNISYNKMQQEELNFQRTYDMMVNGFEIE